MQNNFFRPVYGYNHQALIRVCIRKILYHMYPYLPLTKTPFTDNVPMIKISRQSKKKPKGERGEGGGGGGLSGNWKSVENFFFK